MNKGDKKQNIPATKKIENKNIFFVTLYSFNSKSLVILILLSLFFFIFASYPYMLFESKLSNPLNSCFVGSVIIIAI